MGRYSTSAQIASEMGHVWSARARASAVLNEHGRTDDTASPAVHVTGDNGLSWADNTLSLVEAAERLGVSERTVLRRIQKGALSAYKVETPHGQAWRITLDSTPDSAPPAANVTPTKASVRGDTDETTALVKLLEDERRERAALVQRNEQLAGQVGFLQAKLQDAQEEVQQLRLLMAPKDEPAEPEPTAEPVRVSWWRRWFT